MFDALQQLFDGTFWGSLAWGTLLGYGLGSIPFGLILTRWVLNVDLRTVGSGNIGATNVLRTGDKALGAWTLVLDMCKGLGPVLLGQWLFHTPPGPMVLIPLWIAACAVLGHMFPVWLYGRGGKGVATYFGTLLALDIWVGCTTLALWLGTVRATHISSLGAIVAVFCAPFLVFFVTHRIDFVTYTACIGLLVLIRHTDNIRRLLNRSEPLIGEPSDHPSHNISYTA